ncbi:MAG: ATP-binding protein [Endomicrobium sp.]|jgi:hypothetical protein|nr:ATP-binding protein [Endomicrobium sp.]
MKNLPISTQSFEILRQTDCVYVDKTKHIFELIKNGRVYFLSRPRRFGKSLLISTFEELFKGNKRLFEGLYIYDKWVWSEKYPIIHLDFADLAYNTPEELKLTLNNFLNKTAAANSASLQDDMPVSVKFSELIEKLYSKTGQRVVVLVDEYDKPITDNLSNKEVLSSNKTILHDFYQVIKAKDKYIKFVFLTGVSKFSGVSIFSGLNNLMDITLSDKFAGICGYTQEELEENFKEYIYLLSEKLKRSKEDVLKEIRRWYNGYSWDGMTTVYNPFSTLLLFADNIFTNYWFRTGTPTFLIELLKSRNQLRGIFEPIVVENVAFDGYDEENIDTVSLLFQTGYLTIKQRKLNFGSPEYTLAAANFEVKDSLVKYLLNAYSNFPLNALRDLQTNIHNQIQTMDAKNLSKSIYQLFVNIPYTLHISKEAYWHSLFLATMNLLGFVFKGDVLTNIGRIDAVWEQPDFAVICEIKYDEKKELEKMLETAFAQIDDRRYYETYLYSGRKIILLAVAFNGKAVKCKFKELDKK